MNAAGGPRTSATGCRGGSENMNGQNDRGEESGKSRTGLMVLGAATIIGMTAAATAAIVLLVPGT